MRTYRGFLYLAILASPVLRAQNPAPFVKSANSSADYSTTIAQGSLFVLFGNNLGPAALAEVTAFPLPNVLSGTSVTATSGATTLNCPMIYTSFGQVAAILPSNIPTGQVSITVSYNGQTDPHGLSTTQATVVANSPGMYTVTSSGLGTGSLTDLNGKLLTYSYSAKPGDDVYLWGTGLGPINTPDNVLPPSFPNFPNIQVWVGGLAAKIVYAGRSGCCAAVDQIVFTVPAVGNGCNVPVTVVSGASSSNTVTMPVSGSGGACSDTGPTLPTSILSKAAAGQEVKVAAIALAPAGVKNTLRNSGAVAQHLSAALRVPVSQADAAALMRAYQSHDSGAFHKAMAKYAVRWKALHPRTKARLIAEIAQSAFIAEAVFGSFGNEGEAAALGSAQLPAAGSCVVLPNAFPSGKPLVGSLDAGPSLSLTGAGGSATLNQSGQGSYSANFGSSTAGQNLPQGSYTISGTGGNDVLAFSATITVGSNLVISNASALTTIDRTQPVTVTWTGGVAGNYVLIGGESPAVNSANTYTPASYFACAEDGGKGTFTIPSYILSAMNPTAAGKGGLLLSPHPLSNQIAIPGIDLAYFIDGSGAPLSVTFK